MMLKGQPGSIATGAGWLPGAASQSSSGWPAAEPSRDMHGTDPDPALPTVSAEPASVNSRRAPASTSMRANASGVLPGASGATTTPARSAPR
jgi:hypothetical protein